MNDINYAIVKKLLRLITILKLDYYLIVSIFKGMSIKNISIFCEILNIFNVSSGVSKAKRNYLKIF